MSDPQTMSKWNYTEDELQTMVGKHLLVAVAYCKTDKSVVSREQFHGRVLRINFKEGIILKLHGSENERAIPLDFSELKKARKGQYTLTNTQETVEDPDFTMKLVVYQDDI